MSSNIIDKFIAESVLDDSAKEDMKPFFENLSKRMKNFKDFTDLQKTALQSKNFWDPEKNIIVQGATSAGKTLIAECSMAYQIYSRGKQVLYLVPLKALTTDKEAAFKEDFAGKRIYTSSSDYQEHDYELTHGDYDIGILVYEKFFALTVQNKEKLLENCGLIVIDEMHMLSDQERGPKLEFAIEKVRYNQKNKAVFLGLTTTECNMESVRKWLNADKTDIIRNQNRPVNIEESFIYCDHNSKELKLSRYQDGKECTDESEFRLFDDFNIPQIPNTSDYRKLKEKTDKLFQLMNILKNHSDCNTKIIIFCNSKKSCPELMQNICRSGVLPKRDIKINDFPSREESEMESAHYHELYDAIINYGVAYHNASLGVMMRNFIEKTFNEKNEKIKIIIATETLTMGVNMPADIMILYDNKVYRGEEKDKKLTYQEYKNAIGRAGRYGISKNNCGISYMITSSEKDMNDCKNIFTTDNKTKIISGLTYMADDDKDKNVESYKIQNFYMVSAPYYMAVLNNDTKTFSEDMMVALIKNGLEKKSNLQKCPEDAAKKITDILCAIDKYVGERTPKYTKKSKDGYFDNTINYSILRYGSAVFPFALCLATNYRIRNYFLETKEEKITDIKEDHMPVYSDGAYTIEPPEMPSENEKSRNQEQTEPETSYFFDVMFEVCQMPEARNKKNFFSFSNMEDDNNYDKYFGKLQRLIFQFFEKFKDKRYYWENSILYEIANEETDEIEVDKFQAIFRVMILYYWVLGYDAVKIREEIGLPNESTFYIYSSELQNLAEICAHLLEAISKCFENADKYPSKADVKSMFYNLSIRVKYGMSRELSRMASKHVAGITRPTLLRMERAAKNSGYGSNVVDYFLRCTPESLTPELKELRARMKASREYTEEKLIEKLKTDNMISDHIAELINSCTNNINHLSELLEEMRIDNEIEDDALLITDSGLRLYLCYTKECSNSDEIKNHINYESKPDYDSLIIYNRGIISDAETSKECIKSSDFELLILNSISEAGSYHRNNTAKKYLLGLLKEYVRSGIRSMRELSPNIDRIRDDQYPTVPNAQNVNIFNNCNFNQTNNTINNYFIQYEKDLIASSDGWSEAIERIRKIWMSNEDFSYIEEAKEIALPASIPYETVEDALKESDLKTYRSVKAETSDVPGLFNMYCQAAYLRNAIAELKFIDDYAAALTMFGKSLEHCLKKRLLPIFKKDCPEYEIGRGKGKEKLKAAGESKITLGTLFTIIANEYCEKNNKQAKHNNRIEDIDQTEKDYWNELSDKIKYATDKRNDGSHAFDGNKITLNDVDEFVEKTEELFKLTNTDLKQFL